MRFYNFDVTAVGRGVSPGQSGSVANNPQGFQIKNKNGQLEIYRKNGEPITKFKAREEYHFAKQFLATQPKSDAYIKLSNKLDGYNGNEGLRKSVWIDPANKQQVIIFGKKYQIPAHGLDMHSLMDTVRGQAGLPEKDFNKLLEDKYGLKETSQTKSGHVDLGGGYSYKLIPPTLLKGDKPITKIESPEEYKKIKAVLNKYHAESSVFTRVIAGQLINQADSLYGSQVKESKGKIFIFGIEQKTEVRPDVNVIRRSLMEGKSAADALEDGLKATGTSVRLEDSKKGDSKYQAGETIYLFHEGKKIEGLVTEVKQDKNIKTIRVHHKESDTFFEVTVKTVNGKEDFKNAKVKHLGSEWTFGEVGRAEFERANIKAKQVLGGKDDPYDLKRFSAKEKASETDSDKLVRAYQKTMAQFEGDMLLFISYKGDASSAEEAKKYLEGMENLLRKAGFSEKNIKLIMARMLKDAFQRAANMQTNVSSQKYGIALYQVLENYSSKLGVDPRKSGPVPWGEIWKMITKPGTLHFVTPDWKTKSTDGKSRWDKESQKISGDIKTDQSALMNISQDLVAKHGSEGLPVEGLKNIKIKETRVLLSKEADPFTKKFKEEGSSQTLQEYVVTGYSSRDKKYVVIEPSTGARFEGDTEDEAMQSYCKGSALNENSIIAYRDSKGVIRQHTVEYSLGKRLVDSTYRAAVAVVIVGTIAATMGAGAPAVIAAATGGAAMAVIDTGELAYKAANGQMTTWKDWTMAGVDALFSIVLPGLSKLGKFAKVNFLAKNGLIDKATADSLKKLSKTNPAEYEKELTRVMREAYEKKPKAFMDAVKVTSKEMANPYRKGELQVEKVYLQGADGKLTQVKSRYTRLTQEEALKKYGKAMEKDKNLVISGEDFVLASQDRFKGQAVFHIHPKITVKPQYAQGTFTGEKDISEALGKMGVSYEDVVGAATSDNKVRIICQVEGKGYVAITAEIEFTADGKKVLKSMTAGHVAFNESLGNTDTLKNKNRAVTYRELQQYTERLEGYRATYMEARTKMNAVLKNAKDKLKVLSEEYAPKLSFNQANALERNKLRNELIQKRNQIINEAQTEIDLINNKVALNFTQVVVPAVGENKALYQKIDNTNRALKDMMNRLEPLQRSVAQTSSLAVIDQAVVSVKRDIHYLAELLNDVRAMKTQTTDPVMLRYLEYQEQSIQGMFKMSAGMLIGFTNRHHDLAEFNRLYSFLNDKAKAVFITWEKDFLAKNDQLNVVPLEYRIKAVKNLLAEMNS